MLNCYNRNLLAFISIVISCFTSSVVAQPYSWQVTADYNEVHPEDITGIGLSGLYYFAPVATNNGPLQQAAFIQRSSSIGMTYRETEKALRCSKKYQLFAVGWIHRN